MSQNLKPKKSVKQLKAYKIPDVYYSLPIPCLLWVPFWLIGIVLAEYHSISLYLIMAFAMLSLVIFAFKKTRIFSFSLIALLAGYLAHMSHQTLQDNHISKLFVHDGSQIETIYISENQKWQASSFKATKDSMSHIQQFTKGKIVSNSQVTKTGFRYTLELLSFSDIPVKGKITLFTDRGNLKYGDIIEATLRITENKATNPGEIDYTLFQKQSGIYASAFQLSPIYVVDNSSSAFVKLLYESKTYLREKLERTLIYSGPMAISLIFGEKQHLDEYEEGYYSEILPQSGIIHFFAVSGVHVVIIAMVVIFILRLFRVPLSIAKILTIVFLIFYAFLCNSTPPVIRAVIFFALFLAAQISNRLVSHWQVFLFCLFLVTFANPSLVFSVSLQFSYLAFMGIIVSMELYKKIINTETMLNFRSAIKPAVLYMLNYFLLVSCIQLLLIPVQVHYFYTINLNMFIGNLFGLLLIGILLPLFFLILLMPESFFISKLFIISAEFLTDVLNHFIIFLSKLPFVFQCSRGYLELFFMFCLVSLGSLLIAYSSNKKQRFEGILLCLLSFVLLVQIPEKKGFQVIFFDVGNSDACLIRFSEKDYMLVDVAEYENNRRNISRNLLPYLKRENVKSISKVILSHAHSDHYGGIFKLSEKVKIDTLIVTDKFLNTPTGREVKQYKYLQDTVVYVVDDTLTYRNGDYSIKFLHPDKDYKHGNENNLSIVCKVSYQDIDILFTGDIEVEAEQYLMSKYSEYLPSDILKVPHHGSRSSSSEGFIELIRPELFVVSAIGNERRGFPNRKVIETANKHAKKVYVTGRDGAVIINGL